MICNIYFCFIYNNSYTITITLWVQYGFRKWSYLVIKLQNVPMTWIWKKIPTPLTSKKMVASLSPFAWVVNSTERTGVSSLHAITNFMTSSSTSYNKPSPITAYTANPSYTRAASYHRSKCVKGGEFCKQEVMSSYGAYGRSRLVPSSKSDWGV